MAHKVYRDAVTGEYVSERYAEEHPDTTVSETVQGDEEFVEKANLSDEPVTPDPYDSRPE